MPNLTDSYFTALHTLLLRRALGDVSDGEEVRFTEEMEYLWHEMTPEEQEQVRQIHLRDYSNSTPETLGLIDLKSSQGPRGHA